MATSSARGRGEGVPACGDFHRSASRAPFSARRPSPRDARSPRRCSSRATTREIQDLFAPLLASTPSTPSCSHLISRFVRVSSAAMPSRLAFDVHGSSVCLVEISQRTPRSKSEKPSTSRIPTNLVGSQRRKQSGERGPPSTRRAEAAICRAAAAGCPTTTPRASEEDESEVNALALGPPRSDAPRRRRQRPPASAGRAQPGKRRRPLARGKRAQQPTARSEPRGPALPARAPGARRRPSARALGEVPRAPVQRPSAGRRPRADARQARSGNSDARTGRFASHQERVPAPRGSGSLDNPLRETARPHPRTHHDKPA